MHLSKAAAVGLLVGGLVPAVTLGQDAIVVTPGGFVGIGTSSPACTLHVAAGEVRFPPASDGAGFTHFNLGSPSKNFIRGTTIIADNGGSVGVGTATPFGKFHVGSGEVVFPPAVNGLGYTHFNHGSGNYIRGTTMIADNGGKVAIGCVNPTTTLALGVGNGATCGTGTYSTINAGDTNFIGSSSRTIKENLSPVEVPEILERIAAIDVYTYDFIDGRKDVMGLMAEDFHGIFGRGSEKTISGQEVDMALWLAVQQLAAGNKELVARNQELVERLAALEARIAAQAPTAGADQ